MNSPATIPPPLPQVRQLITINGLIPVAVGVLAVPIYWLSPTFGLCIHWIGFCMAAVAIVVNRRGFGNEFALAGLAANSMALVAISSLVESVRDFTTPRPIPQAQVMQRHPVQRTFPVAPNTPMPVENRQPVVQQPVPIPPKEPETKPAVPLVTPWPAVDQSYLSPDGKLVVSATAGYETQDDFLLVRLTVTNRDANTRLTYAGWDRSPAPRLHDEFENGYQLLAAQRHRDHRSKPTEIVANRPVIDVLTFERAESNATRLYLELSGEPFGLRHSIRFQLSIVPAPRPTATAATTRPVTPVIPPHQQAARENLARLRLDTIKHMLTKGDRNAGLVKLREFATEFADTQAGHTAAKMLKEEQW